MGFGLINRGDRNLVFGRGLMKKRIFFFPVLFDLDESEAVS